jgi:hypothetical protein
MGKKLLKSWRVEGLKFLIPCSKNKQRTVTENHREITEGTEKSVWDSSKNKKAALLRQP